MTRAAARRCHRAALLTALLAAPSAVGAFPDAAAGGPLPVREQFLPWAALLALEPTLARPLASRAWEVEVALSLSSTWVSSHAVERLLETRPRAAVSLEDLRGSAPASPLYHADGDLARTRLALRRGLGHGVQLSLALSFLEASGGFGDGLIEAYHEAVGLPQSGRTGARRNDTTLYLRPLHGREVVILEDPGHGLGDIVMGAKFGIPVRSGAWLTSLQLLVKLPTGEASTLRGSGRADVGVQWLLQRTAGRGSLHAVVTVLRLGEAVVLGLPRQTRAAILMAYERKAGRRASLVVQTTLAESPFKDLGIGRLEDTASLADAGVRLDLRPGMRLFFGFSENLATFGSAADVALHIGLTLSGGPWVASGGP